MTVHIGIDPGLSGAIAVLRDGVMRVCDLPTKVIGGGFVKRAVDGEALLRLLGMILRARGTVEAAALEVTHAMPGQGTASMYSMGRSYGAIDTALHAANIKVVEVRPQQWKAHYGLLRLSGETPAAYKARSVETALGLYPLMANALSRAKDHNRAEAILLAHYIAKGP